MKRISAVFIVKNEEHRIRPAIESAWQFADEVVVVDDESQDRTADVARSLGARVYIRALNRDFGAQYMFGIEQAENEWVFLMDADEIVPKEAGEILNKWKEQPDHRVVAYNVFRVNHVFGKALCGGEWVNRRHLKLIKKGKVQVVGRVHSRFLVDGDIGELDIKVLHFPLESISQMLRKIDFYTELQIEEGVIRGWPMRRIKRQILTFPFKMFWKNYIRRKGYKDGILGLVWLVMVDILNREVLLLKEVQWRFAHKYGL